MLLVPYNPFPPSSTSPYAGSTAIFIHARECDNYSSAEPSEQQLRRQLSLRAYDVKDKMVDLALVDGSGLVEKAQQFLGKDGVDRVFVYYAGPGCFAVMVERG